MRAPAPEVRSEPNTKGKASTHMTMMPATEDAAPAETSQTTPATLPEVRYYQISDA